MCSPCCPNAGPPPSDLQDIAGSWTAPGVQMNIGADGKFHYQGGNKSIDAAVSKWDGDEFKSTVCMCCGGTYHIDEKPHQEDGQWKMKVNGIEMTRN